MGRIIAVSNNKGGCGKTVTTVSLASLMARQGHKVLIIDTDNQGNATMSFNIDPDQVNNTIYDILIGDEKPENVIISLEDNLYLLPSNDDISFLEFEVLSKPDIYPNFFNIMNDKLQSVKNDYDFIFIDTQPNLGLMQGNVLNFANEVIIPFHPEGYSMRSLVKMLDAIYTVQNGQNPDLKITGVLITMYERTRLHKKVVNQLKRYCKNMDIHLFETIIPKSIEYPSFMVKNASPITLSRRTNKYVSVYYNLRSEILNGR